MRSACRESLPPMAGIALMPPGPELGSTIFRTFSATTRVPNIFGMNFQAVSVGQKLIEGGVFSGYTAAAGTPTPKMKDEIMFVDDRIGQMVNEFKKKNLLESTLLVIMANQ